VPDWLFRVFSYVARRLPLPTPAVLPRDKRRLRRLVRRSIRLSSCGPHFAVDPCLGPMVFPRRISLIPVKRSSDAFRPVRLSRSFARHNLAGVPAGSSPELFAPFSTCRTGRSTCRGAAQTPLRSALRVWSPSRRLSPFQPGRICFAPAALLGFALQSVPLSQGGQRVSTPPNLHTVGSPRTHAHT
jgi:hypothetical protein